MNDNILEQLAEYIRNILGYEEVTIDGDSLLIRVPAGAVTAGHAAGSLITIRKADIANCSGQFSWLAEQINDNCPTIYKCHLGKKKRSYLPGEWKKLPEEPGQLLLVWWNVSIRAVNLQEELILLGFWLTKNNPPQLLPQLSLEEEEHLLDLLPVGTAQPNFTADDLTLVSNMSREKIEALMVPKVTAAMKEVEERRQFQMDQISTYYFLTSKRLQERINVTAAQQYFQLENLAQDKARLISQLSERYSAESVITNIIPEVVVLCDVG